MNTGQTKSTKPYPYDGFYSRGRFDQYIESLGLEHLDNKRQYGAIKLVLTAYRQSHKHKWHDGFVSISSDKWRDAIGGSAQQQKHIEQIKKKHFIQANTPNKPAYSHKDGVAKAFALTSQTRAIIEAIDRSYVAEQLGSSVIERNGKAVRRDLLAIDKRKSGGLTLHDVPGWCPVNVKALTEVLSAVVSHLNYEDEKIDMKPTQLQEELRAVQDKISTTHKKGTVSHKRKYREYLTRVMNEVISILDLANSRHHGLMPQHYKTSAAGRFYATGLNLQNCSRLTRTAALHGYYSYDIESCHHTIVMSMSEDYGIPCEHLQYYVQNKTAFRAELADALGGRQWIPVVKEILIAIIYGAKKNEHFGVIQERLKADKFKVITEHPRFNGLYEELQDIFKVMIEKATRDPETNLVKNALGRTDREAKKDSQQVAHLLQGIESQALQAVLSVHQSTVVPLHDGWVCTTSESIPEAERAILKATGIPLEVGEPERLELSGIRG